MPNQTDVKDRVLAYLESKGGVPGRTEEEKLRFEYLNAGLIDSMGIVEMLQAFEAEFGVRFSPSHMQSVDFQTVGGLVRIIAKLSA